MLLTRPRLNSSVLAVAVLLAGCASTQTAKYGDSLVTHPLAGERLQIPRSGSQTDRALEVAGNPRVQAQLVGLRVSFIANKGEIDGRVAYYVPTLAGTVFVTQDGQLVYSLPAWSGDSLRVRAKASSRPGWSLTETFHGGTARPMVGERGATRVSYFIGSDPSRWRTQLESFEQVNLGEVWPGITVALRAHGRSIEKVFTVQPGATASRIRVRVGGADALAVDRDGALVAGTGLGDVTFTVPSAYQERGGARQPVTVAYRLTGREYGFAVGAYDRTRPLIIDPLIRSTYLGGSGNEFLYGLAIHPVTHDVYVSGITFSTDFPGTGGGAKDTITTTDAFVARLSSDLTTLTQATYLGGSGVDFGLAMAIHPTSHDVYVAGTTTSTDFPNTLGGAQPTNAGGPGGDAFIAQLSSDLTTLVQATYLGGSTAGEQVRAISLHPTTGDVYVGGPTTSSDFPKTAGGAQVAFGGAQDAFVARLSSDLKSLTQATYFGGTNEEGVETLAIHPETGDVYVASCASADLPGTAGGAQAAFGGGLVDGFVARFSGDLTVLGQATYLGGAGADCALSLAIHLTTGDVYVTGQTESTDFPGTSGGAQPANGGLRDAFIGRLNRGLTSLTQATYLGGSGNDGAWAVVVHPATGDVYVAGPTGSIDLPRTSGAAQPALGGADDAFISQLTPSLTALIQTTYLGGGKIDQARRLAIDPATGDVYVAGDTLSIDFPGTDTGAQPDLAAGQDAFIARLTPTLGLAIFVDVPFTHPFRAWIEALLAAGITGGCSTNPARYCPDAAVTRDQMAVFLLLAIHGPGYDPPAATGMFTDVPIDDLFAPWIEQLAREGITKGCSTAPLAYCPNDGVTRGQMAVFILRAKHGPGYQPPDATGAFTDVARDHPFAQWIEQLARDGITGGCATSPLRYCPDVPVTRGQMAVFLVRTFQLPL